MISSGDIFAGSGHIAKASRGAHMHILHGIRVLCCLLCFIPLTTLLSVQSEISLIVCLRRTVYKAGFSKLDTRITPTPPNRMTGRVMLCIAGDNMDNCMASCYDDVHADGMLHRSVSIEPNTTYRTT